MGTDRDRLLRSLEMPPAGDLPAERLHATRRMLEEHVHSTSRGSFRVGAKHWTGRRIFALAATLLALVTVWSVLRPGTAQIAQAATPQVLAGELSTGGDAENTLQALANSIATDAVANDPDTYSTTTEQWSLSTRVDEGNVVHSAVIPQLRTLTWSDDLSGVLRVATGSPQFPSDQYREAWIDEGSPAADQIVLEEHVFASGEFVPMYPAQLPTEPDELYAALSVGHPIDEYGTAELFQAIVDLNLDRQPRPTENEGVLRLLGQRSDVMVLDVTEDRAGRDVVAVATDSDYSGLLTRYILMVNPVTGQLLAAEQVLFEAGHLSVSTPAVIHYILFDR